VAVPAEQPTLHHVVIDIDPNLVVRSEEHQADLIREFKLMSIGDASPGAPGRLADLVVEVLRDYQGVQEGNLALAYEAIARGDEVVRLEMDLPFEVIDAVERINGALEEADAFCRRGEGLLTLAAPDDILETRRWFVAEIGRQVRASATGAHGA
jgi:hypothetical protein